MAKPIKTPAGNGVPLQRRSLTVVVSSANIETRTVSMIVATETPALQYVPDPTKTGVDCREYVPALEILSIEPGAIDFSRSVGMPFVDSHDTYSSIDRVLGTVANLRIESRALVAEALFRRRYAELVQDIADGHLQQVSVGYQVFEYELVGHDEATGLPIVRAVRWCPHEVSSVAVGADAGAVMRSANEQLYPVATYVRSAASKPQENTMELDDQLAAAEQALAAADEAITALQDIAEDGVTEEQKSRLAKLRARAEGDKEVETDTTAADADVSEADKKVEEETRSLAKRKGKDVEEFAEGLRGLKRGKAFRDAVGDFVAARAIAKIAAIPAVTPVIPSNPTGQRSVDLAKELDHVTLFERRKRGYVAGK